MPWPRENSIVLIEQVLQIAALLDRLVTREARRLKMPVADFRTLVCMGRHASEWEPFSTPSQLCESTGLPKTRVAEALGRLRRKGLVQNYGNATSDGRTRAFQITKTGGQMVKVAVARLQLAEGQLRIGMRVQSYSGTSMNLVSALRNLRAVAEIDPRSR